MVNDANANYMFNLCRIRLLQAHASASHASGHGQAKFTLVLYPIFIAELALT
jgi:hypothetical protein